MTRILIVDDSMSFRQSLKEILLKQFLSSELEEAGDKDEALEQVERSCPDLIFMDIRLPHTTGLELTREIKAQYPGTRVVVLTGFDSPEYREAATQCGADHFLSKDSATSDEILQLVESILSQKRDDSNDPYPGRP